jgi:exopolyphosphatase/guanosine-5'-triphosphate,3'-diphosphate pyrophosphatase
LPIFYIFLVNIESLARMKISRVRLGENLATIGAFTTFATDLVVITTLRNMQPSVADEAILELGSDCYAAVDLGSNSFHLVISRYNHGEFTVIDRQREVVRLAAGLDDKNYLSEEVAERALRCLTEFGQLLASLPTENIRAVGTNALRRLHGKNKFLERAEFALGHSIEIIAGREEARLIYLGVSKWSASQDESRLVIDIGGGSTEIIAGKGDTAHCRESLEVGCVVLSAEFFADGALTRKRFDKARLVAELAIQPVVSQFRVQGWNQVIGCSGTMKSMALAMAASGWSTDIISKEGLYQLLELAVAAEHLDNLVVPGVSRDRMPVFAGGLSILIALFDLFDIQEMSVSDIALREGVLYDLVGRSSAEDVRDVTVSAMLSRWDVDALHGEKVGDTASMLYHQVVGSWDIRDILFQSSLQWSAQLHEVGLQISHDGYHQHGAYVVANADMAGFAKRDQLLLAALISGHRRKFPLSMFESLPSTLVTPAKRIAVLLRISVLLHRGRGSTLETQVQAVADGQCLELTFDNGWLASHPLTKADLKQESSWLKSIGVKLNFR